MTNYYAQVEEHDPIGKDRVTITVYSTGPTAEWAWSAPDLYELMAQVCLNLDGPMRDRAVDAIAAKLMTA